MRTTPDRDDPILTTRDAARLLGVAVSTAQMWMEGGALPTWKTPGGHRRVRLSDVERLVEERRASAAPLAGPDLAPGGEFLPTPAPGYPMPPFEARRLAALQATRLLDSPPEEVFDRVTWLASQVSDCPMAVLTLLTARRQWFKSRIGVDVHETPREVAFCSHAIMEEGLFVVEDARNDPRFAANPLVTGAPYIRFYAGYPVRDAHGLPLGSLCVLDREPRRLRERELRALRELAAIASDELQRRA